MVEALTRLPWSIVVGAAVLVAALVAEWMHARRIGRIARLAFGARAAPAGWVRWAALARALSAGVLAWAALTLIGLDGAPAAQRGDDPRSPGLRRLVIALDVSPSMSIADAGAGARSARADRAREVVGSLLGRLDLSATRVSVVAFYTSAKPVVVDTIDLNVVENILDDLPLEQAFEAGKTDLYSGVREAAGLAAKWPAGSATLVVVSDGDTISQTNTLPALPAAIGDVLVLGVGNPARSSPIGPYFSRQDSASLRTLATRLRGRYFDGNARHVPSAALAALTMLGVRDDARPGLKIAALTGVGAGSSVLALLPAALAMFGGARHPAREGAHGAGVELSWRRGRTGVTA